MTLIRSLSFTRTHTHNYWFAFSHTHAHVITHACKLVCPSMQEHSGLIGINVTVLCSRTQWTSSPQIRWKENTGKYLHNNLCAQCDDTCECSGVLYLWIVIFFTSDPWNSSWFLSADWRQARLLNEFSLVRCFTFLQSIFYARLFVREEGEIRELLL